MLNYILNALAQNDKTGYFTSPIESGYDSIFTIPINNPSDLDEIYLAFKTFFFHFINNTDPESVYRKEAIRILQKFEEIMAYARAEQEMILIQQHVETTEQQIQNQINQKRAFTEMKKQALQSHKELQQKIQDKYEERKSSEREMSNFYERPNSNKYDNGIYRGNNNFDNLIYRTADKNVYPVDNNKFAMNNNIVNPNLVNKNIVDSNCTDMLKINKKDSEVLSNDKFKTLQPGKFEELLGTVNVNNMGVYTSDISERKRVERQKDVIDDMVEVYIDSLKYFCKDINEEVLHQHLEYLNKK